MENKQVMKKIEKNVNVVGDGKDMNDAISKIFSSLRNEIYKTIGMPIVEIKTEEVFFEDIQVSERKERFLFLFMPRVKKTYIIKARILVTIKYICLDEGEI